jgi:hypothetical protein
MENQTSWLIIPRRVNAAPSHRTWQINLRTDFALVELDIQLPQASNKSNDEN